jgi:hyperosmotically inducible protein
MRTFLSLIIAGTLAFSGCSPNPKAAPETRETKMSDSDLEAQVKAKLNNNAMFADKLSVDADVDKNMVTLSGTVETQAQRMEAVNMAKSAHPGLIVEDKIDVKPAELTRDKYTEEHAAIERSKASEAKDSVGSSVDDAWIHSKIVAKLIADSDTPERKINVDVKNNVVTLRGRVDSAEAKAEAGRIATETDGVKSVNNQLKVAAR